MHLFTSGSSNAKKKGETSAHKLCSILQLEIVFIEIQQKLIPSS